MNRFSFVFLALLCYLRPAWAQEDGGILPVNHMKPVITVIGSGSATAKPDYANLFFSISVKARTSDEALRKHEEKRLMAEKLFNRVKENGVSVEKVDFSLREEIQKVPELYNERTGRSSPNPRYKVLPPDYIARTSYTLRTDNLEKLNEAVTTLISGNVFTGSARIRYFVNSERLVLNKARRLAAEDAKEQAAAYVEAVGQRLGKVVAITDGEAFFAGGEADLPVKRPSSSFSLVVPPRELSFSASVKITWGIE